MHGDTGRFIEDDHVLIFPKDIDGNNNAFIMPYLQCGGRFLFLQKHGERISRYHGMPYGDTLPVQKNAARQVFGGADLTDGQAQLFF